MDNKTKKYLADIEKRIMKLEAINNQFYYALQNAEFFQPSCNMCGIANPSESYVCSVSDCCQGLNPNDNEGE